jgi:hypothetical protein
MSTAKVLAHGHRLTAKVTADGRSLTAETPRTPKREMSDEKFIEFMRSRFQHQSQRKLVVL